MPQFMSKIASFKNLAKMWKKRNQNKRMLMRTITLIIKANKEKKNKKKWLTEITSFK